MWPPTPNFFKKPNMTLQKLTKFQPDTIILTHFKSGCDKTARALATNNYVTSIFFKVNSSKVAYLPLIWQRWTSRPADRWSTSRCRPGTCASSRWIDRSRCARPRAPLPAGRAWSPSDASLRWMHSFSWLKNERIKFLFTNQFDKN